MISDNRHAAQYSRSLRVPRGAVSTTRRMRSTRRGMFRVGSKGRRCSRWGFGEISNPNRVHSFPL